MKTGTWNSMYRGLPTTLGFRFVQVVCPPPAERAASYPALAPDIRNNDHDVTRSIDSAFSRSGPSTAKSTTPTKNNETTQ
ncbi:hypothetical protein VZT92_021818 [Zoarces viviparus]|uniref:Uncharacterized protein n=1 Tax=Zoarces viviparus TaxID=48416 RepID=A0AAW1E9K6_ZOAVI